MENLLDRAKICFIKTFEAIILGYKLAYYYIVIDVLSDQ